MGVPGAQGLVLEVLGGLALVNDLQGLPGGVPFVGEATIVEGVMHLG